MSTEEYVRFLRQGDFTLVLEWLTSLFKHYSLSMESVAADTIIPLMTFELINNRLTQKELSQLPIINAVLHDQSLRLPGPMEYGLTLLMSAAMQYQVYEENKLIPFYQTTSPLDSKEVIKWMTRDNDILSEKNNSDALAEKIKILNLKLPDCHKNVEKVKSKILTVVSYQYVCKEYLDLLIEVESLDEKLVSRIKLVNELDDYLHSEFILTSRLIDKVAGFLSKIRELTPDTWEEKLLSKFLKKTFIRWLYEDSIQLFRFFTFRMVTNRVPIFKEKETNANPSIVDKAP